MHLETLSWSQVNSTCAWSPVSFAQSFSASGLLAATSFHAQDSQSSRTHLRLAYGFATETATTCRITRKRIACMHFCHRVLGLHSSTSDAEIAPLPPPPARHCHMPKVVIKKCDASYAGYASFPHHPPRPVARLPTILVHTDLACRRSDATPLATSIWSLGRAGCRQICWRTEQGHHASPKRDETSSYHPE